LTNLFTKDEYSKLSKKIETEEDMKIK
jgi:hypothetical protein